MRPQEQIDRMVAVMRAQPDETWVRYRINNNDWQLTRGREFLKLWDQPFAGTIDLASVTFWADEGSP